MNKYTAVTLVIACLVGLSTQFDLIKYEYDRGVLFNMYEESYHNTMQGRLKLGLTMPKLNIADL